MNFRRTISIAFIAIWVILSLPANGYFGCRVIAQSEPDLSAMSVKSIGVMPFLKGRRGYGIKETIDTPLAEFYFSPDDVSEDSDRLLTGYVHEALEKIYGDRVIPLATALQVYEGIAKDRASDTPRTLAQKTGAALGTTVIMGGNVWRYRRRIGGAAGVESPAAVGFGIYLIDVTSGRMLWRDTFEETQKSLSENVLNARKFFKRGARWLTADKLARYGVKEIFEKYPY